LERQRARLQSLDLERLIASYQATFLHVISDDPEVVRQLIETSSVPVLVSSWRPEILAELEDARPRVEVHPLAHDITASVNALIQIRDVVLGAYVEGFFGSTDRVLVVTRVGQAFEMVLFFDMHYDESVTRLKKDLEYRADIKVIEAVLQVASEIAREGRERGHVGALFVIGDTRRVLEISRQVVINPFQGHPEPVRDILDPSNWETAKEFSQIDGAFVISEKGIIEAAGRYIEVKQPVSLPSGLGGRHLAAAAVTKETKAIGIVVSETGVVRLFKDGEILLRIGTT
jgi:DNA integrity scanning protein DisA with diadenylate cyclase activity